MAAESSGNGILGVVVGVVLAVVVALAVLQYSGAFDTKKAVDIELKLPKAQ